MTTIQTDVAIIGGGLSGLFAAHLLHAQGQRSFALYEARERLGGRIHSVGPSSDTGRFDLGATWFWPAMQPELMAWVTRLGLSVVPQHEEGDMMVERHNAQPPLRTPGWASSPPGVRLRGGMAALIDALAASLPSSALHLGVTVQSVRAHGHGVRLEATDTSGRVLDGEASHVLLAIPPRLAAARLHFTPSLPDDWMRTWRRCATWMAPHAKYVAVYPQPFWRSLGLSGAARSAVGPMVEIHDASSSSHGALFGFLGVPANWRRAAGQDELLRLCRGQLVRLYGEQAGQPLVEYIQDWAQEPFTAAAADQDAGGEHPLNPPIATSTGDWAQRLYGAGSEWSSTFPGYVAGAVDAAKAAVASLEGQARPTVY
jgi:monoamine oxidase